MIELWGRPNSNNVMSVIWTLDELDLKYVRHNVGGTFGGLDTGEFLAMNPNGRIPVLRDDTGVLYESTAIARYLASRYCDSSLWPTDLYQRAVADQWMDWFKSTFYPAFIPIFWQMIRVPDEERDDAVIDRAIAATSSVMAIVENRLRQHKWLAGDQFTLGDIPLGACMYRYYNLDFDRPSLPSVDNWYHRLCQRPAYQTNVMIPFGNNNAEWLDIERSFGKL